MSNKSSPNNNQSSSRWWEYYLARYLLPSITGVFIVLWLTKDLNYKLKICPIKIYDDNIAYYISLLLCGFAYCYIASFPALAFHAIRSIFFTRKDSQKIKTLKYPWRLIILTTLISTVLAFFHYEKCAFMFFLPFITFSAVQIFLLFQGRKPQFNYIKTLSTKRTQSLNDITDSYRHLREHGNTALIFILEIILAIPCNLIIILYKDYSLEYITLLLVIWSLPSVCVYFLGQYFEYRFATDKKEDSLPG